MTEWRTLPDYPAYQISEDGAVRRAIAARRSPAGRILKPYLNPNGYYYYCLITSRGKGGAVAAHRLVCEAWNGPPPFARACVAHTDGKATNNHFSNLRWATYAENSQDQIRHRTIPSGERHPHAKLTWEVVREIRRKYETGGNPMQALADHYGVSLSAIHDVIHEISWREAA